MLEAEVIHHGRTWEGTAEGGGGGLMSGLICSAFGSRQFSFPVLLTETGRTTVSPNSIHVKVRADGRPGYIISPASYKQLWAGVRVVAPPRCSISTPAQEADDCQPLMLSGKPRYSTVWHELPANGSWMFWIAPVSPAKINLFCFSLTYLKKTSWTNPLGADRGRKLLPTLSYLEHFMCEFCSVSINCVGNHYYVLLFWGFLTI